MKDSRQEESSILVTSSSGRKKCSSRIATWQEFYSDGVGEIKMRKVIDMSCLDEIHSVFVQRSFRHKCVVLAEPA